MKKAYTLLLMGAFLCTLLVLARYIFLNQIDTGAVLAVSNSKTGTYKMIADFNLGKVEVFNFQRMGFTHGFIQFSPDNAYLAAGTENGDILLMTAAGQKVWHHNIGVGKISALAFTGDGRKLLIGETSPQGSLVCFDVSTGQELWRLASATEIEADIKQKIYPGIVHITTDGRGFIYAVGQSYNKNSDGSSVYRGRIYKVDEKGNRVAMFPADHNLDAWVSWVSVDREGRHPVFSTGNWDADKTLRYGDNIYCLDSTLERPEWSVFIDPAAPYQNTTMRSSPDISADGAYIAAIASDGRCFLYDNSGKELWRRTLSKPQKIGGVYINAIGVYVQLAGDYVVLTTGNTYNRANWQLPTPIDHPARDNLFIFDLQGNLVNKYDTGGMVEELSVSNGKAILAVGRNVRTKDTSVHGVHIVSIQDGRLIDQLSTAGPCIGAASTADGKYIAGVEAPLQLDDGQIIGGYHLYIWERQTKE